MKDPSAFEKREEALWKEQTRFDKGYMEEVLHEDFFEFGRSGKRYTRKQIIDIDTEIQSINCSLPLEAFKVSPLSETLYLVTYISEVQYETLERSNRSSLWEHKEDQWKLLFHQGTPIEG